MATRQAEKQHGPTWQDVIEWSHELETSTHRKVSWKIVPWYDKNGKHSLAVVIYLMRGLTPTWHKEEVYSHGYWPTNEHKTMPGLLIALLHEAEKKWTEQNREATEQARF